MRGGAPVLQGQRFAFVEIIAKSGNAPVAFLPDVRQGDAAIPTLSERK
jgi:hypothetical protein